MTSPAILRLARPANIVTAWADILAGYAASGSHDNGVLFGLIVSTSGLYGGGVVLNDFFDSELDRVERPERPIPSAEVSRRSAGTLGVVLLFVGIIAAFCCSAHSGMVAIAVALAAVTYDSIGKHHPFLGPINMGLCRGLNLALGLTASSIGLWAEWPMSLIGLCFIAGVTCLSRGEVKGGTRGAAALSAGWLAGALGIILFLLVRTPQAALVAVLFFVLWLGRIGPPFLRAFKTLQPSAIRSAIKAGVLSLIALDAALAATFAGPWYGIAVLLLYIPATLLAKWFAVT